ncbi:MAG TPA: hypothetical protein VLT33_28075 [Labilithrix sp.]|nr:hypothetical protein [Labilithrix sp.]
MRGTRIVVAAGWAASIAMAGALGGACSTFSTEEERPAGQDGASEASPASDAGDALAPPADAAEGGSSLDGVVLASGFVRLSGVAADESTVYFIDREGGGTHAVAIAGGTVVKRLQGMSPSSIAVGADATIYWADFAQGSIGRISPSGAPMQMVVTGLRPVALAIGVSPVAPALRMIVASKDVTSTVKQFNSALAELGGTTAAVLNPFDVAVVDSDVYWTDASAGTIFKADVADSASGTALATSESDCQSIAADVRGVYWARPGAGLVQMRSPAGSITPIGQNQTGPHSLAADERGVYWMTRDGKIRRSARNETPLAVVAQGFNGDFGAESYTQAIALTSKYVVWITADGKVLRLDR